MTNDVPNELRPYLDEIAGRLWSYRAAVMVGAGFSQNAEPVGSVSESFPNWRGLGDLFYEKLQGTPPNEDARYLSLLKLAEQVQAAFGRPALDRMILRAIPDLRFAPSPLHSKLLSLPWADVFTTNYDTLLERARASVALKHYHVVFTQEDLLQATGRRIVKLHGSLPSPPFVITEEDYRRYPSKHASFVNTVRQSLLEKTLCLIGFSGDDPNFVQWIGWMRDQVGHETAPKIYLIGVFANMTEADRKLLSARGIVPVDLSALSMDHRTALGCFFAYLEGRRTRALEWPDVAGLDALASEPKPDYRALAAKWRQQRICYPGWVVMPGDRRSTLWGDTERKLLVFSQSTANHEALETPTDLDFAFELAWRSDRCLFPLTVPMSERLKEIAAKYTNASNLPVGSQRSEAAVAEAVTNIRLWLLRYYREEGQEEMWHSIWQEIDGRTEALLPEHRARFRFEEALHALYRFDPGEAKRLLVEWQSDDNLPFWEAKRAAMMAELGEVAAARSILESSLSAIRRQQSSAPVAEDYTLVSQESIVMLLLWAAEHGLHALAPTPGDSELFAGLSERWNELTPYKCDPRREINSLVDRLRHPPATPGRQESTSYGFDLGATSKTVTFGFDEEAVTAYGLLRLYEDIGMPFRMENVSFVSSAVKATLPRIGPYSPHWALVNLVRLGDAKAADWLFNREYVAGLKQGDADRYFEAYLPALDRTIATFSSMDSSDANTFESLAQTLPEVFSRLSYKCSPASREKLLSALYQIYGTKRTRAFANVYSFTRRLLESMSIEERVRAVPTLIDFPVPDVFGPVEEMEYINPLRLLRLPDGVRPQTLDVSEDKVDQLLDRYKNKDPIGTWASTSLAWLHQQGKLNERQSERFGSLLWDDVLNESSTVPTIPGFHSFACIRLPHPPDVELQQRVKESLKSAIDRSRNSSRLGDLLVELSRSAGIVTWSIADGIELLAKFSQWWQEDKGRLDVSFPSPFGSPAENARQTASGIVSALSEILIRFHDDDGELHARARAYISDVVNHGIAALRLEAAIVGKDADVRTEVINRIETELVASTEDRVSDSLAAARLLALALPEQEATTELAQIATIIAQGVEWRHRQALMERLQVTSVLVNDHPWFLSAGTEASLLRGLNHIAEETSAGVTGNDEEGVILTRASAASLAFQLFRHYQQLEKDEPPTISRWRNICSDPNEFAEVRNAWINVRLEISDERGR